MPLWGSVDNAANSAIYAVQQFNQGVSTTNRNNLFDNTTANVIVSGQTVGQFGIDVNEHQAAVANAQPRGAHAGWNLRTVGQGGRAGRVFYETLVAMGSMTGDASDDTQLPDAVIVIRSQPTAQSIPNNNAASFSVLAEATPYGSTITYQWQRNGANISDGGVYSGATTSQLSISNVASLNANSYGVLVYANGLTKLSSNAVLTVV